MKEEFEYVYQSGNCYFIGIRKRKGKVDYLISKHSFFLKEEKMNDIFERSFVKKYKGYRYMTARMPEGHCCGYIEIPEEHYLYGKNFNEPIPEAKFLLKELQKKRIGKRSPLTILSISFRDDESDVTPEMIFDVNGGINFSRVLKVRNDDNPIFNWAIGFSTDHFNDNKTTQTHKFCEDECKNLIDQLVELDNKLKYL